MSHECVTFTMKLSTFCVRSLVSILVALKPLEVNAVDGGLLVAQLTTNAPSPNKKTD